MKFFNGQNFVTDGSTLYVLLEEETKLYLQGNGQHFESDRTKVLQPRNAIGGCKLCLLYGEKKVFYLCHCLKDQYNIVCYPILRRVVCPICGASGDQAHTLQYCGSKKISDVNNSAF